MCVSKNETELSFKRIKLKCVGLKNKTEKSKIKTERSKDKDVVGNHLHVQYFDDVHVGSFGTLWEIVYEFNLCRQRDAARFIDLIFAIWYCT